MRWTTAAAIATAVWPFFSLSFERILNQWECYCIVSVWESISILAQYDRTNLNDIEWQLKAAQHNGSLRAFACSKKDTNRMNFFRIQIKKKRKKKHCALIPRKIRINLPKLHDKQKLRLACRACMSIQSQPFHLNRHDDNT